MVPEGFEGVVFHPDIEPEVIITSDEEEAENFFEYLRLCRKSDNSDFSHKEHFTKDLTLLEKENQPNSSQDSYRSTPQRKKQKRPRCLSKAKPFTEINPNLNPNNPENNHTPVRPFTAATQPHAQRRSSPLEQCPICKKYFRRMRTHRLKHEIRENPAAGIGCNVCPKVFTSQNGLQAHMKTHLQIKPHSCTVCHKSFTQSCNLVNHMRIHTGEKPFKCPYCERGFTQSGNLANHIRTHTAEKPFQCHFCDKAFVQSGNLDAHIRNYHPTEDLSGVAPGAGRRREWIGRKYFDQVKNVTKPVESILAPFCVNVILVTVNL